MESGTTIKDRIRENTPEESNEKIESRIKERMTRYRSLTVNEINERLEKLQKEWDIERAFEVNASSLALTGAVMGLFGRKIWLLLPAVVAGFFLQHGIQGWCPPINWLRSLGYRTRQEINEEIFALKTLRGDFDTLKSTTDPEEIIATLRNI